MRMITTGSTLSAIVAVGLAFAPSLYANSPLGDLLLTKTCDTDVHCTVITSEAGPLPEGTEADYFPSQSGHQFSSKIVLTTPDGDTAKGHCAVSNTTGVGTCTFTSGTGALDGFHAIVQVSFADGVFTWEGKYHFVG